MVSIGHNRQMVSRTSAYINSLIELGTNKSQKTAVFQQIENLTNVDFIMSVCFFNSLPNSFHILIRKSIAQCFDPRRCFIVNIAKFLFLIQTEQLNRN
jgi:hypothetical protein